MATCDLDCNTPRISRPKIVEEATIQPEPVDSPELRERMKELLEKILSFFEEDLINNPNEEENENL